ncbi:uncharacterized protein MONBRDRAFT_14336, partial [Monosiga brevicollis MX1]
WSKGKSRDKLNNAPLLNKEQQDRLLKEIPVSRLITPSTVSDRLKIKASLARRAIADLIKKDLIKPVVMHHGQIICTRNTQ